MQMNKRGQSLGDSIVYSLMTIFGVGILGYFVIEVAIIGNVLPSIKRYIASSTISPATQTIILTNYGQIVMYLRMMPIIIFVLVLIYLVVRVFKSEREMVYE